MDWVTFGISIYAGFVATATGAWAAYGVWRDRTSVKVEVRLGYVQHSLRGNLQISSNTLDTEKINEETRLIVTARNVGRRSVVLSQGGFQTRDHKYMFAGEGLGSGSLPRKLDEGDKFDTWTILLEFCETLKGKALESPLSAYWETEAGRVYKTKVDTSLARFLHDRRS